LVGEDEGGEGTSDQEAKGTAEQAARATAGSRAETRRKTVRWEDVFVQVK
jgi:hypothetical protein